MVIADRRKRVTIKDVAQAAGVSTQTVSRVMNKFSYVSEETRQRVETVVEQLGYHPSTLARSLIQQRSYTLGVVTFGLKYIGPSRTLNGVADKADELGYMLLMKELDNFDTNRIDEVIDSLLARQVDGIIWVAPEIGDNHAWVEERMHNIPAPVLFLAMKPRAGISSVATDNYQGAVLAIQHLLECGRKKIGHISGPLTWWEADERKRGWFETLKAAGLNPLEEHCAEGNWSSASGEQAFTQLLASYPDMDAVFVANDQMALSVLRETCCRGICVPDQLAVIGFDNIAESAYFYPSLTTISQDLQLLGEQAVQSLVEMIQARQNNQVIVAQSRFIQPTLVVRESSKRV
ncbi:MAG TPA: LacI family DNA-binding transcriptional regulator [Anaerolineales bacterium]|nr:LacI family DNA-binding transcriptional regulator [Anaerolineales bacterium]HMV97917.1 LacI family DNA-binding transcriptional regulator [Anaerolineales bacterium]HMX17917.1 LacI family DNA-binding transcriptional regulator [Anaerolineales bacterium]HMX73385.1 LacI family DNA-binding transcriptional regulator [Anaerolineales bacterium]HMZ44693.1 LacI family DNA-binding transcriptional regulator [Anaerolineales bacterium]